MIFVYKKSLIDMSSVMFSLDRFSWAELSVFFCSYYILEHGMFIVGGSEMKRKGKKGRN